MNQRLSLSSPHGSYHSQQWKFHWRSKSPLRQLHHHTRQYPYTNLSSQRHLLFPPSSRRALYVVSAKRFTSRTGRTDGKSRKSAAVEVDYLIHVQELKPWPSSQALKSVQSVLLQWENGEQVSGSCICNVGDGKIEFRESFTLPVTLYKEKSRKSAVRDSYLKNNLEFYLYEPRKDKGVKGQLLGSAVINLADYGIIVETRNVSTPLNWKKSFKSSAQPVLYVSIQPCGKSGSSLTPKSSLSREVSLENDGTESVPESANDGNDEIASFTDDDDDVSSHSSRTVNSSAIETTVSSSPSDEKKRRLHQMMYADRDYDMDDACRSHPPDPTCCGG